MASVRNPPSVDLTRIQSGRGRNRRMRVSRPSRLAAVVILAGLALAKVRAADTTPEPKWTAEQRQHWSFLTPARPEVPVVKAAGRVRNPIDAFILSELEGFGITPAPEADRGTLIR